jgi:ABC-type sugar transport system ATPase subunit
MEHISKSFGTVQALQGVSLDVHAGQVLALVGENGAGKSTLLRILSGDHRPDDGRILVDGTETAFDGPAAARAAGIRVIYQEPEIVPALSVAENLFMGELPRGRGRFVRWRELHRASTALIRDFDPDGAIGIRPGQLARTLSPAQRQVVEILRALKGGARVLALDEPTSSLNEIESERLFLQVDRLRAAGVALIYVSHRLREVVALADRTAVLRDGQLVALTDRGESSEAEMIRQMVGRPITSLFQRATTPPGAVVLSASGLTTDFLRDVSLELRAGEIVGVAGLVGAGRTELAKALFGARPGGTGGVVINGMLVTLRRPPMPSGPGSASPPRTARGRPCSCAARSARTSRSASSAGCAASGSCGVAGNARSCGASSAGWMCGPRRSRGRSGSTAAATSRRWCWRAGWRPPRACCCSTSRRAASMSAPRLPSTPWSGSSPMRAWPSCSSPRSCRRSSASPIGSW